MSDGQERSQDEGVTMSPVTVLNCVPGYADEPETGQPIGMVTLADPDGGIEEVMFSLRDVRRLTTDFLRVLAHHGDERAEAVLSCDLLSGWRGSPDRVEGFIFNGITREQIVRMQPPKERAERPAKPAKLAKEEPPPKLMMTVRYRAPEAGHIKVEVLGGYSVGKQTMVLYRSTAFGKTCEGEGIAALGPKNTIKFKRVQGATYLPKKDWAKFDRARPGYFFKIGSQTQCLKLKPRTLRCFFQYLTYVIT